MSVRYVQLSKTKSVVAKSRINESELKQSEKTIN
jgi:hypothetical protein